MQNYHGRYVWKVSLYQEVFLLFILSQKNIYLFFYLDHFDLWQLCMRTCIFYLFLRKPFDFGALKKDCMYWVRSLLSMHGVFFQDIVFNPDLLAGACYSGSSYDARTKKVPFKETKQGRLVQKLGLPWLPSLNAIQVEAPFLLLDQGGKPELCSKKNWREPSIWFLWKSKDFLVAWERKLGSTGHQALLEHCLGNRLCLQGATKHAVNNICNSSQTFFWYWGQNHSLFLFLKFFLNTLSSHNKFLLFCCRSRKPVNSLHVSYIECFHMISCLPYWFPQNNKWWHCLCLWVDPFSYVKIFVCSDK